MSLASLMIHTADVFNPTFSRDSSGGVVRSFPASPTIGELRCNVQEANSTVIERYKQRDLNTTHTLYHADSSASITVGARVTFDGSDYRVVGLRNHAGRSRVFSVDLEVEQS